MSPPRAAVPLDAVRALNAQLSYLAQLWSGVGIAAGELRIELSQLHQVAVNDPSGPYPLATRTVGAPPPRVTLREFMRVADLAAATSRHRLLRRFADRLANAYGELREPVGFEVGRLYTAAGPADGRATASRILYLPWDRSQAAWIGNNGAVRRPENTQVRCWWQDGILLDLDGHVVAALEFATADSLPIDYLPTAVERHDALEPDYDERHDSPHDLTRPEPTGVWSDLPISKLLCP
jgi:hypothetical protein